MPRSNGDHDAICCGLRVLMLPDPDHLPPQFSEMRVGLAITLHVAGQLAGPPLRVGLRRGLVLRASVPEATINEHDDTT